MSYQENHEQMRRDDEAKSKNTYGSPFEKLRQNGFKDPRGHHLVMCASFVEAEANYTALLAACESMSEIFAIWQGEGTLTPDLDALNNRVLDVLRKAKGGSL